MDCIYCSTSTIEGRSIRKNDPEKVVNWIDSMASRGFTQFFFVDNNFNIPVSYAKEICRHLDMGKKTISWRCIFNPLHPDDELIRAMAKTGCVEVSLGFESGCSRILKRMNKHFTLDHVRQSAKLLKDHGIRRMGFLLLGGPSETKDSVEESIAFAESLNLEMMRVTAGIRIYPETLLAKIAREEGVITPNDTLLLPKFYVASGLENWLQEKCNSLKKTHPHWIF